MSRKLPMIKTEAVPRSIENLRADSASFSEQRPNYKLLRKNKAKQSKYHCYHWKQNHNKKYLQFLVMNYELFHLPLIEKRRNRLFIKMSRAIGRKTLSQCHSHHRTMIEKYDNIDNIIKYLCLTFETTQEQINEKNKHSKKHNQHQKKKTQNIEKAIKKQDDCSQNEQEEKEKPASQVKLLKEQQQFDYVYY